MSALWLAWRELLARRASLAAGVLMMAAAAGLCAGTELGARARAAAMAFELDSMGPALTVLPLLG